MPKVISLSEVYPKYVGLVNKIDETHNLFENLDKKGKCKIPKYIPGIENKHMLKKALDYGLKAMGRNYDLKIDEKGKNYLIKLKSS